MTPERMEVSKTGAGIGCRFTFRGGDFVIVGTSLENLREVFEAIPCGDGEPPFNPGWCKRVFMVSPSDTEWERLKR